LQIDNGLLEMIFEVDGSYRDIYIFDTQITDWQTLFNVINKEDWVTRLLINGEEVDINQYPIKRIFDERDSFSFLLSINYKGVVINSHFFDQREIEFDIYPKEIVTSTHRKAVFEFMQYLSNLLNKQVIITPENSPENPYLTIKPNEQQ
jgi:hypothetical protein